VQARRQAPPVLKISSIRGNRVALDGGAMFGHVPRALWAKWYAPDDQNRIELTCRAFLVEDGERRILIETGIGAFFEPKLQERYGVVESGHVLLESLRERGLSPGDIDVVLLSHLHFDHAGGVLAPFAAGQQQSLVFPRATFVTSAAAYERAVNPHKRDRASFIPGLAELLRASGRLRLLTTQEDSCSELGARIRCVHSTGHTDGMLLPFLQGTFATAVFCADLIPGVPWIHLPITMGYDRFPEQLVDEKEQLYGQLGHGGLLLFTHDPDLAAATLGEESPGRYVAASRHAQLHRLDLDALS
jgi:glyoxylase-like metal-dependent hydrolase (beta-lactamase superfamily II)